MGFYDSIPILVILLTFRCFPIYSQANLTDYNSRVEKQCPVSPSTCKGVTSKDGRVLVTLSSGVDVMCDTETGGGGWIIFQRRINGNVDFYRGWEDYKYGFGDYDIGEFYLGNEIIHQLTTKRRFEMRVDLRFNNTNYFASYSHFRLYGEVESYRLEISDFSGNATDNLLNSHAEQKFSTFDKDNDGAEGNCALAAQGAWWYGACHHSNLNGKWANTEYAKGLNWQGLTGWSASVTMSEMKIREI